MASNIFTLAKKYQKQHPKTDWQTCIQKVKGKKSVGAYKVIERGENKKTPVSKTVQTVRTKTGTFKGYKTVSGFDNKVKAAQDLQHHLKELNNLDKQKILLKEYCKKTGVKNLDAQIPNYKKQLLYINKLIAVEKTIISKIKSLI